MPSRSLSRRTVLRGTVMGGAVMLHLPLLEVMLNTHGTALANGEALPRRFAVWFYGNGVKLDRWIPDGEGANYTLSSELEAMSDLQDDITIVSGTHCPVDGQVHHSGQAGMLSGDTIDLMANDASTFRAKSVDVLVSEQWAGDAAFDLINLAIYRDPRYEIGTPGHISYNGTGFNPNEVDPGSLYDRIFSGVVPDEPDPVDTSARAAARSRALDSVLEDFSALNAGVGRGDQVRLEQHMDGLRDLQKRIEEFETGAGGCTPPERPTFSEEANDDTRIGEKNAIMSELVARAFACDMTRVASIMHHTWYSPAFREIGIGTQQHGLTHDEPGDQPQVHATATFVMSNLATFIRSLKAIPEGAGTVLDNSVVYAVTDVSDGRTHSKDDMPIVLAGGAGGRLLRGHHIHAPDTSSFKVMMSLFRALDLGIESFGAGGWAQTEPLSELLV
ncbi:MAG: DUF1552 domain-containing protein [Myxococcota bacterium]